MSDDFEKNLAKLGLEVDPVWKRLEKSPVRALQENATELRHWEFCGLP